MTKQEFTKLISNNIVLLDGASGTEMQKMGMPKGVCPEKWAIENPDALIEVQKKYVESGSNIVYSFTFGANPIKLEEFGLEKETFEINKKLAEISKKACGGKALVAGDISGTGKFVVPFGELEFENCVNAYKEQVRGLLAGGVDLFAIETMIDLQETRAALIAVKELCDLPVITTMTFSTDGFSLTGNDPLSSLICLQSLGASAFGCNCSTGPDAMLAIIEKLKPYAKVPLVAKPNAGLPRLVDGITVFDMKPTEFASYVQDFVKAGVNLFGGCCGTSPEYIKKSKEAAKGLKPLISSITSISALSSARKTHILSKDIPVSIIGERINPTGKKKFQEDLRAGNIGEVRRFASEQSESGADIIDVNMGTSGINEEEMMIKCINLLSTTCELPLTIDSSNPVVIEKALRIYPGRALINSISAEKNKIEILLPIAAKYGAMFILLPLNDNEIPATAEGRKKIVLEIFDKAKKFGFERNDIVVDGLVLTVASDQNAAKETLKLINWSRFEFGVNSVLGLSNVSFGLPERKWVNSAFLAMAVGNGLTMAIANPNDEVLMTVKIASDVLTGTDTGSKRYINKFSNIPKDMIKKSESKEHSDDNIYQSVIEGNKDNIVEMIKKSIENKANPKDIVDSYLIKAINKVGDLYDKKQYFLPQLIASAEAMKTAFGYLEPYLEKKEEKENKAKIILATVKGDIHDIGKNIVGLMLRNYGFEVIDLGKDVPAETIINEAVKNNVKLIGLSALMTTTMTEMKVAIDLAVSKKLDLKFIVGGAVINENYAKEINADGYAKDSVEAVKIAKKVLGLV